MRPLIWIACAALSLAGCMSYVSDPIGPKPRFKASLSAANETPPAQSEYSDTMQVAPVAARPGVPSTVYDQPYACFTDEGYGRFASCDQAGF